MMVSDLLQPLVDSPRLLFIVIMISIMVVGMVMDLTPTVLILTPVLLPLVKKPILTRFISASCSLLTALLD